MELQADCLAGVWANLNDQVKKRLEPGDIDEALNAASQIGDDMIQKRTQGRVVPDAFTHGSAAQRVRWFKNGFESGPHAGLRYVQRQRPMKSSPLAFLRGRGLGEAAGSGPQRKRLHLTLTALPIRSALGERRSPTNANVPARGPGRLRA